MYRPRHQQPAPRRGIVLLVVLALLTLFAIVGISFVLYANSEANSSRYFRESETPPQADMDPELLISMFLSQVIYDVDDDTGLYSALRGHSLARNMYGYYYRRPGANDPNTSNIYAFNGVGRMRGAPVPATLQPPAKGPDGAPFDDYYCINYMFFPGPVASKSWLHDPERPGWRRPIDQKLPYKGGFNPPYTYPDLNNMFLGAVKAGPLEIPGSPVDPKTAGAVLIQSFHRPWLFGPLYDPNNPTNPQNNPNWGNTAQKNIIGKYLTLRPRPVDQLLPGQTVSAFPYPEDPGGDVKNLINSPGYLVGVQNGKPVFANNDSIWIDLGAPVMTAPDGTKFKPLFAPLIVDLDNRINVNVHGNIRGRGASHVSNQGWGPWEVNVGRVLNYPGQANEWSQLLTDLSTGTIPIEGGRYFFSDPLAGHIPLSMYPFTNTAGPGETPHPWGPVDYDGCQEEANFVPSDKLNAVLNPRQNSKGLYFIPSFPPVPNGYGEGSPDERTNHPLVYNFFSPYQDPTNAARRNLVFPISNMEALLRYGETNSPGMTSSLFRLCASNFADPNFEQVPPPAYQQLPATVGTWTGGASRRNLVTTHSFGLDRPGVSPWWWNDGDTQAILSMGEYNPNPATPTLPTSKPVPFPPLNSGANQLQNSDFFTDGKSPNSDWRTLNAALNKLDLNRKLTPYPITYRNPQQKFNASTNPVIPFNLNDPQVVNQYQQAVNDRVQFAQDILSRLMLATGAYNPVRPPLDAKGKVITPTLAQVRAVAYLAQLAVNIVDFIDGDDIMTGLNWLDYVAPTSNAQAQPFRDVATGDKRQGKGGFVGKNQYVWGTELPRVLLNEVYGEFILLQGNPMTTTNNTYEVDIWVELYNPLSKDVVTAQIPQPADPAFGTAYLQLPGTANGAYRLELYRRFDQTQEPIPIIHQSSNPTGEPNQFFKNQAGQACQFNQFIPAGGGNVPPQGYITPSGGAYNGVAPNGGFYVLGPNKPFPSDSTSKQVPPTASLQSPLMSYMLKHTQGMGGGTDPAQQLTPGLKPDDPSVAPTIVLQRLANPYLPWNDVTNPYVTIDFLDNIHLNNAVIQGNNQDQGYKKPSERWAYGKLDPFVSASNITGASFSLVPENRLQKPYTNQPQHTFFRHNGTQANMVKRPDAQLNLPFSWLPHPDRQLISPMELLMVPGFKPAELTHRFKYPGGDPNTNPQHLAPWLSKTNANQNRLYRFFEFVETHNRATGVARGGRIPGLVNLNTVWDPEILMALCDPQPGNDFVDTDIYKPLSQDSASAPQSIFWRMMKMRSPGLLAGQGPSYADRPFLGNAPGVIPPADAQHPQYPQGTGINDSFLRSDNFGPLFQTFNHITSAPASPYITDQLMYKLFNNVTTRSNVFAVWVTVGFFQVTDDTTRPVKLGAEIGKAENRNIRHRMFAIVDRSNLTIDTDPSNDNPGPPIFLEGNLETLLGQAASPIPVLSIAGAQFTPGAGKNSNTLSGTYEGIPWSITKDSWVQLEPQPNQTTPTLLQVTSVNAPSAIDPKVTSPTITLKKGALGAPPTITSPMYLMPMKVGTTGNQNLPFVLGNPGPKPGFNPRNYPWIVRYFSIIN